MLLLNQRDPLHPRAGGAEIHLSQTFGRLARRGWEVTWAVTGFAGAAACDQLAGMRLLRLGRLSAYYPRAARLAARHTRRGAADLVIECLNKAPYFAPVYSAAPVVAVCHHLFGATAFAQTAWPVAAALWCAERLVPKLYGGVSFVTISESSRRDLIARGVVAERIRVIPPGAPRVSGGTDVTRRPRRVICVSRLEPYKRIEVLLRAAARLAPRFPDLEIAVVGTGSDRDRLERLAERLGIASRCRFTGFVSDRLRDELLASSRVSVCASRKEGFGLSVIESSALGTPVVASDVPGLRDAVIDGETGFLVAAGDVEGFAERIAGLLSDDALAARVSEAGRRHAERFDWDRCSDEMAMALEAALAR